MSEVAKDQQTDPLSMLDRLQQVIQALAQNNPEQVVHFKSALLLLSSSNGISS
ncbi:hypothetical protein ACF3NA_10870 [Alkanindiges sp. WGS2144]|uniref:hypothetical protein n=1 Tax=Alkanindiges sp. WGS2144 TaxID=3366808 RepID=UPI003753979C